MRGPLAPTLVALVLVLAAPAAGAVIRGKPGGSLLLGTNKADRLAGGKGPDRIEAAFGGADRVDCGGGHDLVSADLGDRVAADCEIVSRRLSVDASTSPSGQHETAVEPDSFSFGSTVVATFQLGRIESGAAVNIGTAVSTDAGRTGRRALLPSLTGASTPAGPERAASDPTVAYDAVHGVWLVGTLALETGTLSHVLVSRSQDGEHWTAPVTVATGPQLDKDWFVCDNGATSPFRGRCYATYTDDQKSWTVVQYSNDGGVTWSQPVKAADFTVGTQPLVRPDGGLAIVSGDYNGEQGLTGSIVSLVSADGGSTFTRSIVSTLTAKGNDPLRAIALPSADIDPAGKMYAVWHDCRFHPGCSANDLVLSTSSDGMLWTRPVRIALATRGVPVQAFLPGIVADPNEQGHLGLLYGYWEPKTCPKACLLDIAFVTSADGGATWSAPQELSPRPMRTAWLARSEGGRMVGDYFSSSFASGRFVAVFTLAVPPLADGRFREAVFAASLAAYPHPGRRR
ncbi:MAG TPA: sialidase family protein [Gaiellaceae bacterium]|nr:sialidase family protein [Gaiellaceae bacterium]